MKRIHRILKSIWKRIAGRKVVDVQPWMDAT